MKVYMIIFLAAGFGLGSPGFSQSSGRNSPAQDRRIEAATGEEVGIARRDGITISGADVIVTRNGRSEMLERELRLNNGLVVRPDGTLQLPDGRTATLRVEQTLTFDGTLLNTPVTPTTAPSAVIAPGTTGSSGPTGTSGTVISSGTAQGRFSNDTNDNNAAPAAFFGGTGGGSSFVAPLDAQTATSTTVDPTTGQPVFTGTDPRTGRQVSTTTDPRTGLSITTTTDASGNRISQTQDPTTGLPVTTTTDSRTGRTTSTTQDPRTGRTVPANTAASATAPGARPGAVQPPASRTAGAGTTPSGVNQGGTVNNQPGAVNNPGTVNNQPGAVNNPGTVNGSGTVNQQGTNSILPGSNASGQGIIRQGTPGTSQQRTGSGSTRGSGSGSTSGGNTGTSGGGAGSPGTSGGGAAGAGTGGGTNR